MTPPSNSRRALPWLLAACIALCAGFPAVATAANAGHHGTAAHAQHVKASAKHKPGAHGKKSHKHGHHKSRHAKSGKANSHKTS